jgi:hypothetical protein
MPSLHHERTLGKVDLRRLMKSNLFLGCFAILLLFLAYTERSAPLPPVGVPAKETASAPLFSLSPETITKISIRNAQQCVVAQKNAGTTGLLREVSAILLQGRVVRRFSPRDTDFPAYGLAPAIWRIVLTGDDDTPRSALFLGHLNPVGNAVYARWQDDQEVVLVGSYFLTAVDVVFERLRSSSLTEIATDALCEEEETDMQ